MALEIKKSGATIFLLAVLTGVIFLSGCAGTRIVETWEDPTVGPLRLKKNAVLFIDPSQTRRRIFEDEIVRRLPSASAVPAYRLFPEAETGDFSSVRRRLRESGFDGALQFKLLRVEEQINWIPGSSALRRPYYFRGSYWYDPGYYRADQIVRVETSLYALESNRLVWSAVTESFNPSSPHVLIFEVAEKVLPELWRQGWLPEPQRPGTFNRE